MFDDDQPNRPIRHPHRDVAYGVGYTSSRFRGKERIKDINLSNLYTQVDIIAYKIKKREREKSSCGQVGQFVGALSLHQKFVGLIPGQRMYVGCQLDPWLGRVQEDRDPMFLSHINVSLSLTHTN